MSRIPSDEALEALRARIAARESEALTQLERLVAMNSFTRNRAGVEANARALEELFAPLGFAARRLEPRDPEHGDHRVLERPGAGLARVLLVSHLDTVYPPAEEAARDFRWREEGERIHGPGVVDIKGGTMTAWLALAALDDAQAARAPLPPLPDVLLLLDAAEEEGNAEFPAHARSLVRADTRAALVLEHATEFGSGATGLVTSRRGAARFRVETYGRKAHAGSAHAQGASALREMARLVERIESLTDHERGLTFNVGRLVSGEVVNSVPDHALALVDMRAERPADFEEGLAAMRALAGEGSVASRADGAPTRVVVTELAHYPPWPENEAARTLGERALELGERLGQRLELERRFGASDGNHLWDIVPTLDGLGPAGADIHSSRHEPAAGARQESLRRASLAERALLLAALLCALTEEG